MTITIDDIARETGVSRGTVSLVLRESPLVAAATRERVRATMQRLGYRPNRMAASLRSKRSFILGLIVSDLTYPTYAQMAAGVEEAVEGAGYSLIITNSHSSVERERRHVENLSRYSADGLIVTPVQLDLGVVEHLRVLAGARFPLVSLYREIPGLGADFCGTDVYAATRQLVGYLAGDLGHRQVAVLAGGMANSTSPTRLAGWRDELAARGLPHGDELMAIVMDGGTLRERGERGVRRLLERGCPMTAILCFNDLLALGALRALHLAGKRVPEEISVAGMGGYADMSPPHRLLTTMADDYRRVGREAGEILLRRIGGDASHRAGAPERRLIPAELRRAETTGPVPR